MLSGSTHHHRRAAIAVITDAQRELLWREKERASGHLLVRLRAHNITGTSSRSSSIALGARLWRAKPSPRDAQSIGNLPLLSTHWTPSGKCLSNNETTVSSLPTPLAAIATALCKGSIPRSCAMAATPGEAQISAATFVDLDTWPPMEWYSGRFLELRGRYHQSMSRKNKSLGFRV
jgi:hypothetical protein